MKKVDFDRSKVFIAIPAMNEGKVIADVIAGIKSHGYDNIVVVSDGSSDDTEEKALEAGAVVCPHIINRGKGAATKTAIQACLRLGAEMIVTMDGDGQHVPEDIDRVISHLHKDDVEIILGSRFMDVQDIPLKKRFYNKIGNILTYLLYGINVNDSQSGFRAYTRLAAQRINTKGDRYEFESEVIREIKRNKLAYKEVPITVLYTDYSQNKAVKQSFVNGIRTLIRMLFSLFND